MQRDGILIEYGGLSPEPTPFPLFTVLTKRLALRGFLVHEVVEDSVRLGVAKAFILDGLRSGSLGRRSFRSTRSLKLIASSSRTIKSERSS